MLWSVSSVALCFIPNALSISFTPASSFPIKSLASRIPFSYTVFTGSCQSQVQKKGAMLL
nr:MAG TPA: hypothetical protein [Caudoviricetes sp.]